MTPRTKMILGIIGGVALIGGVSYLLYTRRKITGIQSWNLVFKNVSSATLLADKITAKVLLNDGFYAQFYQTNRFYIFNPKDEAVAKGYYFSGGKILQSDEGENDKVEVIRGNSVILNLNEAKDNKEFQL